MTIVVGLLGLIINECDEIFNYNSSIFLEDIPSGDSSKMCLCSFFFLNTFFTKSYEVCERYQIVSFVKILLIFLPQHTQAMRAKRGGMACYNRNNVKKWLFFQKNT